MKKKLMKRKKKKKNNNYKVRTITSKWCGCFLFKNISS